MNNRGLQVINAYRKMDGGFNDESEDGNGAEFKRECCIMRKNRNMN